VDRHVTGQSIIDDLICDDGVPNRGHRLCIYDERYNVVGVAVYRHRVFGHCLAIEFAGHFEDAAEERLVERQAAGPLKVSKSHDARAGEKRTQWQLGKCRGCSLDIEGGKVVETDLGKWHASCFCCTQCALPLVGVKQKKEQDGRIFCVECWGEIYAPTCFVCNQKIIGDRIRKGELYRHPGCKSATNNTASRNRTTASKTKATKTKVAKSSKSSKGNFSVAHSAMDSVAMSYGDMENW